jgi:hypothetical protein
LALLLLLGGNRMMPLQIGIVVSTLALSSCRRHETPTILEGTIQSIALTRGQAPTVILRLNGGRNVLCRFPVNRFEEISKLEPAQLLRVRGTVVRESSSLTLENSAIEFAGRKPGQEEDDDD